jgi:nucleoid DNA-binding protein
VALTQIIKELLFTCDKLIIPGFGGFVAQRSSSKINSENDVILPPNKHFIFNPSLIQDDGLFSEFIHNKLGISIPEAESTIKEFVDDLWQRLNNNDTLLFEGIGYFSLNESKQIRFVGDQKTNYNADTYGLSELTYKLPKLHSYASSEEDLSISERFPIRKIMLVSLFIILIGGIAAVIYWKYDAIKSLFHPKEITSVVVDTTTFRPSKDSIYRDTSKVAQSIDTSTHLRNALYYKEPVQADTIKNTNSSTRYYLIAGSFQSYQKAAVHAKYLKKAGFQPEIIEFSQQIFRVSIGEFKTKEEADKEIEVLKLKKGAENVWRVAK